MADPVSAGKALAMLRGRLREHLLGPLADLDRVLEAAERAEARIGVLADHVRAAETRVAEATAKADLAEAKAAQRIAEIEEGLAAFKERATRDVEAAIAEHRARARTASEEADAAEAGRARAVSAMGHAEAEFRAAVESMSEKHELAETAWRQRVEEADGALAAIHARIAQARTEYAGLIERIQALLPTG